jgi:prepilin-type N-terminal cleavage/methylation domain-containing protein
MKVAPKLRGFTLVEMTIVVIVLGVTMLFAIPRYEARKEEPIAAKAFRYLGRLQQFQNHYFREHGQYATHVEALHLEGGMPDEFVLEDFESEDWRIGWRASLLRHSRWSTFGAYRVVFDDSGYDRSRSTVCLGLEPTSPNQLLADALKPSEK